jgi:hypothetical protein
MRRIIFALLCSFMLACLSSLVGPANAGEYGARYVWYSSSCCYQKVVRHEREVRYVPLGYAPFSYDDGPPVYVRPSGRYRLVRFSEFNYSGVGVYGDEGCYWRRAPLPDWRGGWVWGVTTTCY